MGMEPKKPHTGIMEMLEIAESEIRIHKQNSDDIPSVTNLETIQRLKQGLVWSDKKKDEFAIEMMAVGFLLGVTAPGSKDKRLKIYEKFIQKGKTKDKLSPGENGPGRKKGAVRTAMEILSSKVKYTSPYKDETFIQDIRDNYKYLKDEELDDLIKPVEADSGIIEPVKKGKKIKLETAKGYLRKASKK